MKSVLTLSLLSLFVLVGCTEARYGAHLAKQIPLGTDTPDTKGYFKVGQGYRIKGRMYYPKEQYSGSETGIASWYGPNFHGKMTANGETFDKFELTAAHRTLQMPSIVRVTNLGNGKSIILRVNDRGPFAHNRVIDVSQRAAELLDFTKQGTAKVRIDVLGTPSRKVAQIAKNGGDTRGYEVALNQNRVPVAQQAAVKPRSRPQPVMQPERVIANVEGHSGPDGQFMPNGVVETAPVKPSNIYVQAGAFSSENNALQLARTLEGYGQSKVYLANVNNQPFFRVRLGPYTNTDQADRALKSLINNGNNLAKIVID